MVRSAYFFPHALVPGGTAPPNLPGRVPFDVSAHVTDGDAVWDERVTVLADGYARNTLGPNQDPCVLAAPHPFHAFCRINNSNHNNHVRDLGRLLSALVRPGDLILYGKFEPRGGPGPTSRIWIDTVLCVDRSQSWTTKQRPRGERCRNPTCNGNRFVLRDPALLAAHLTGTQSGADSNAYRFNLSDAEATGSHCCTRLGDYRVIVGRANRDPAALTDLSTSFVPLARDAGNGDFSPTFVEAADLPTHWDALVRFMDQRVRRVDAGPRGGWIARFEETALAEHLCHAIVANSTLNGRRGIVALLPVVPLTPPVQVGVGA